MDIKSITDQLDKLSSELEADHKEAAFILDKVSDELEKIALLDKKELLDAMKQVIEKGRKALRNPGVKEEIEKMLAAAYGTPKEGRKFNETVIKLDELASEVEKDDPRLAYSIDQFSDWLERDAGILTGIINKFKNIVTKLPETKNLMQELKGKNTKQAIIALLKKLGGNADRRTFQQGMQMLQNMGTEGAGAKTAEELIEAGLFDRIRDKKNAMMMAILITMVAGSLGKSFGEVNYQDIQRQQARVEQQLEGPGDDAPAEPGEEPAKEGPAKVDKDVKLEKSPYSYTEKDLQAIMDSVAEENIKHITNVLGRTGAGVELVKSPGRISLKVNTGINDRVKNFVIKNILPESSEDLIVETFSAALSRVLAKDKESIKNLNEYMNAGKDIDKRMQTSMADITKYMKSLIRKHLFG